MSLRFRDRSDAGAQLARALGELDLVAPFVLALPRGGVPVAAVVATALDAPLDVVVARKVGAPGHREFGVGAIAEGGVRVADGRSLAALGITDDAFAHLAEREEVELDRRLARYRAGRPLPPMAGRDVVVIDDGLATGVTAEAALHAVRRLRPRRVILAVPVCAADTARRLEGLADVVLCLMRPDDFHAVGAWYEDFTQTSDQTVLDLLDPAAR